MAKSPPAKPKEDLIEKMLSENDPPPILSKVDGPKLYQDAKELLARHIIIDHHYVTAIVLWAIASYSYDSFSRFAILLISAPERECGKTLLLNLVKLYLPRPLECSNITMSALFRIIDKYAPILLIDEADTFLEGKNELIGAFNKGYEQGGFVLRSEAVGDAFQVTAFKVFGPKVIAGIALERHLPDATLSRGIRVVMRRKIKGESVSRLRDTDPAEFANLRARIKRFVDDHRTQLEAGYPNKPDDMGDREGDNWEPLLAVAASLGPECLTEAIEASKRIQAVTQDAQSVSNNLLSDIRDVLSDCQHHSISSAELLERLCKDPEMGWNIYNRGTPLTPRQLAKNLQTYNIKPKTVRLSASYTPKGYEIRQFEDAFSRYLKEKPSEIESDDIMEIDSDTIKNTQAMPDPTPDSTASNDDQSEIDY